MPNAVDPSLVGKQLPIDHSPLNRIDYRFKKPEFNVEDLLNSLKTWIADYLFPAIEDLTGIDLSAFLPLLKLLDLDFSSPAAFLSSLIGAIVALPAVLLQLAESLIASSAGLLGAGSPLNALNLFNLVPTRLIAHIPASHIGDTSAKTNLVADPNFLDAEALSGIPGWTHDPAGGYGNTTAAPSGSMTVTADGTTHELLMEYPIQASQGQVMPIRGKAKWTGLAGTGTPVALGVTGYDDTGAGIDQQTVAQHNVVPSTTDWLDLAGTYTVPAGVTGIRLRCVVAAAATAGTVSFSVMGANKSQPLIQRLIAGTDPGDLLPDDIANLFSGIVSNTLEIVTKAAQTDLDNLLVSLGGPSLTDIENRLASFLDSLSPLNADNLNAGTVLDELVPGLADIHDAVVTAVGNLSGGGFDLTKVLEVLTGQTHAVVDNASGLTGLLSRMSHIESRFNALPASVGGTGVGLGFGGVLGVNDTDDFERVSNTGAGPLWIASQTGAGVIATPNGHDLSYAKSGVADCDFLLIRNNSAVPRSATDYQRVTNVLSSKSTRFAGPGYNFCGHNEVWLRVSDDSTNLGNVTGIRIRWGADGSLSIVRFLAGAPVTLKGLPAGTIAPPGPGAQLIGEAGDINGAQRYFRGIIGASMRIDVVETGSASGFGPAFRRWGMGGRTEGHTLPLPGQQIPGSSHHWEAADQTL